ncbi:ROK family protein [Marinisporobacter balticus]|uniref:ROK family protein n=1 Tax=Marinisporobacter balticus TaxID=2018667 RepID=A0A4R2KAM7_9FIRM|nr:ROK family protein [Marinisporobacter balticus]TCO69067.1 ROK family protein [Marinisporobacter balticus]
MKPIVNPIVMKEVNTDIVRNALRIEKQATKQRVSTLTGLSTVTVGTILNQLIKDKEVYETDLVPSNGGRPARSFCYNAEFTHTLIIYTHVQSNKNTVFSSIINLFGECVLEKNFTIEKIFLDSFEPLIDEMIKKYPTIKAIGFGLPGIEYDHVMMINDYEHLKDTCFTEHYKNKYSIPTITENDVNLAALGYCHSHFIEDNAVVYIYFPQKYEPGAGIFINGDLYKGMNNFAGEIKYLPIGINWKEINYFDFDTICSAISKLVIAVICTFNPTQIIVSGEFLTDSHLQRILWNCKQTIDEIVTPQILMSENFDLDFKNGLSIRTLELVKSQKSFY